VNYLNRQSAISPKAEATIDPNQAVTRTAPLCSFVSIREDSWLRQFALAFWRFGG
jgi:hypothetical protein